MQDEAYDKLYAMSEKMQKCSDPAMKADWLKLQASDHFYYMCTKWFSDGDVHEYFNPYPSPYEAFINYMNVLADFKIRLDEKETKMIAEDASVDFGMLEGLTVARVKKLLAELKVEDIAKIKSIDNPLINEKIEKYLGKRKQKSLQDLNIENSFSLEDLMLTQEKIEELL